MADLIPRHPPTLDEQIASVEREIVMRARVYPAWVRSGRMSQAKADHERACMEQVLTTLQGLKGTTR